MSLSSWDRHQLSGAPLREECGVLGIYAPNDDVRGLLWTGLLALQHRGEEAVGVAASTGDRLIIKKHVGKVSEVWKKINEGLPPSNLIIGHTRYSTVGSSTQLDAQPFAADTKFGPIALIHNGNLINIDQLRESLIENGVDIRSSNDCELMCHWVSRARGLTLEQSISRAMTDWRGAFSAIALSSDSLYAIRDPRGFRPLCVGEIPDRNIYVITSETCALDSLGAVYHRDVKPGEVLQIDDKGLASNIVIDSKVGKRTLCAFEFVYFSHPDSFLDGRRIERTRYQLGQMLAIEAPAVSDLVVPVPRTSVAAALGFADVAGTIYAEGLAVESKSRAFIQPSVDPRRQILHMKFMPNLKIVKGKRITLVDDSLVRGDTIKIVAEILRLAEVQEIHVRVASPPVCHPCYMGIDLPTYSELIASQQLINQIEKILDVDTLEYISLSGMMKILSETGRGFCNACFTGEYPIEITPLANVP